MMKRTIFPLLAGALLVSGISAQRAYVFTQVNPPVEEDALLGGLGLTDDGLMAYTQRIPFRPGQALKTRAASLWAEGEGAVLLRPNGALLWANYDVRDLNESGTVVGVYGRERWALDMGFAWHGGRRHNLVAPDHLISYPEAINARGQIVGWTAGFGSNFGGAVMWDENLIPKYLPVLRKATDINNHGQYIGYGDDASGARQAYFFDGTQLVELGTLAGTDPENVFPLALNNNGEVVGRVADNGTQRAFKWSATEGMVELPNFGPLQFPFSVVALDINDEGWVVGQVSGSAGATPAIWDPNGVVTPLVMLTPNMGGFNPWKFHVAYRINEHGQIGGIASKGNLGGRAFLLTPAELGLSHSSSANGMLDLTVDGVEPGAEVQLHATLEDGSRAGYTRLPGCGGMGLAMKDSFPVTSAVAGPDGTALLTWNVPAAWLGNSVRLQAREAGGCNVSSLLRITP